MRYVELFAGAGGLSMGLEAAGMHPVAHAEIEPHARAVLRRQWPDTPLHGDVTQVDWTQYAGQVDLVAGGSPCQDLSVAGKRAGLAGARSGLFYELIRAWDETGAPYCLWENVDGARSSNTGGDFAAVLSAFVGAPVAVPRDGWRGAGVAAGATGVAAWRVLDLQHFGPPQRRRRIFVVAARTGGADPAEILALAEGVCGHPSPRDQSRQGAARGAAGGAGGSGGRPVAFTTTQTPITFTERGRGDALSVEARRDGTVNCIRSPNGGRGGIGSTDAVLAFHHTQNPIAGDISPSFGGTTNGMAVLALDGTDTVGSLLARADSSPCVDRGQPAVLAFDTTQITSPANYSHPKIGDPCHPLAAGAHPPAVLAFQNTGHGWWNEGETAQTLRTQYANVVCTTGDVTHALTHEGSDASEDGTGRGTPIVARMVAFGEYTEDGMASAIKARDHKDATDLIYAKHGRPRRLTPLECERLMGWPDRHAAHGIKEDGTVYALSDTARYRLCGNGVGTPVAAWIATRLVAAVEGLCPP